MNIQDYISTGILEAYALGELNDLERAQVEQHIALYPELKEELTKVEETLEAFAMKAAVEPPSRLKARILNNIPKENAKTVAFPSALMYWKWAAAASVAFALAASYLAINYHTRWRDAQANLEQLIARNEQMAQDYNTVNQKLDRINQSLSIIENSSFTKVTLKGTANEPAALASVYWNATTEEVYLSIQELKAISRDNQFQLWAIVDGKPVDAGVFDTGFAGLLKMKNIKGAGAFAVTVEPRGGKPSPTLETMRVMGVITKS